MIIDWGFGTGLPTPGYLWGFGVAVSTLTQRADTGFVLVAAQGLFLPACSQRSGVFIAGLQDATAFAPGVQKGKSLP